MQRPNDDVVRPMAASGESEAPVAPARAAAEEAVRQEPHPPTSAARRARGGRFGNRTLPITWALLVKNNTHPGMLMSILMIAAALALSIGEAIHPLPAEVWLAEAAWV